MSCASKRLRAPRPTRASDLGPDYVTRYFKHPPKRPPDGVMIAVKKSCCKAAPSWSEHDYKGFVIFGGAEFQHHSGARVRVANGHMRGFNQEQLREFGAFGTSGTWDLQILTADFNEDFQTESGVRCPFPEEYTTLRRPADLPQVSRPPNKQEAGQSSGKGKIDYIWVRDTQDKPQLFFDEASKRAIIESHRNCEETGEWPSDHGCEACSIRLSPKPWWQFWK
ncbi:unnamed protein product [Effrenium voratum]|uniref:Uncharacterized protein n=1 Tax=Effrenium voratum TaxID=2562239 RepID=A0AA36HVY1_9DINO|nr:unnamed protein product [Effrenium voratum]